MPETRCVLSCPQRLPHQPERWCAACQEEHERWLDAQGELAALRVKSRETDDYIPATDAEWRARLDDVAPFVLDMAEGPTPGDEPWFNFVL